MLTAAADMNTLDALDAAIAAAVKDVLTDRMAFAAFVARKTELHNRIDALGLRDAWTARWRARDGRSLAVARLADRDEVAA